MAINPDIVTTVRVGELPPNPFNLSDNIPHEIGLDLFRGTVQQLADTIGGYLGTSDSLAFNPTTVADGGTLPSTTRNEWMLVGKGTFHNVGGQPDIVTTEQLNAITSNGSYWSLAVEIPINVEFAGITQNIRSGYTTTTPSENAVYIALQDKLSKGGYNGTAQDIINLINSLPGSLPPKTQFTADGVQTSFDLGTNIPAKQMFYNSVIQGADQWSQSGTNVTTIFTPEAGSLIQFI